MQASLVRITDPFRPHVGRQVHRLSRRTRVDTLLRRHGLIAGRGRKMRRLSHFVVSTAPNDFLLQHQWSRCVKDGQVITIIAVPAGGSILRTLALTALAFSAPYLAAAYLGTTVAALGVTGSLLAAGITIAGSMLINAVLPLPKAATGSTTSTSSNYGIGAGSNQAKLGDVIPVLYGKFKVTPNYAAQPYVEYDSNSQYLYSLYCITQGQVEIDQILIGNTEISKYSEVQYEVIQPGGAVTLFPTNVYTSGDVSGIELLKPADQNSETGTQWTGPYAANEAGTKITQIVIDTGYPQGLYRINDDGKYRTANCQWEFQAQAIDDNGVATGDWVSLITANEWLQDQTQGLYTTRRFTVAAGRYQVRMQRLTPADMDGSVVDSFYWMGLRGFVVEDAPKYGNVTLLAVQIKATNNINSSTSNQLYVTGTRKLPIWNGSTWSDPTATSSIAWAAADVLRNSDYGRGWADNRIDLATLLELDAVWTARGDYFNGIFDSKTTIEDALTSILRCGRTIPIYYAGIMEFVRDQPQTIPTLVLTPDNIVDFQTTYNFPTTATPDYVQVTYTDPTTWQPVTVDCALTGSAMNTPSAVTLMGCTDRAQAYREGMYMAADNRDRRNTATITVELEGNILKYGDLVLVSHDVPAWGLSGLVTDYDEANQILTLSEPAQWWAGQNVYILLRSRNGGAQGPYLITPGADDFHVVLNGLTDAQKDGLYVSDGISEDPTAYQLGPGQNYSKQFLVTAAVPDDSGNVELTLVAYSTTPYTAENDASVPAPASGSLLINQPTAPAVGGVGVGENSDDQTVTLSVAPVAGAVAYEFQVSYDGGITWISVGVSMTNSITTSIPAGTWIVRARAISAMGVSGAWSSTTVTITGALPVLGAVLSFTATTMLFAILLTWQLPAAAKLISATGIEIWFGTSTDRSAAQRLCSVALSSNTYTMSNLPAGTTLYFWIRVVGTDSGNYSPEVGPISGTTSTDASQVLDLLSGQISETQLGQALIARIARADQVAETQIQQSLRDTGFFDTTRIQGQKIATTIYNLNVVQNDLQQEIQVVNGVLARLGTVESSVTEQQDAIADIDQSFADYKIQVTSDFDGVQSQLTSIQATYATLTQASAIAEQTLESTLGNVAAQEQDSAETYVDAAGNAHAIKTTKVGLTIGDAYHSAGLGIGVETLADGTVTTQVLVQASTFAVVNSLDGGTLQAFFAVTDGQAFINEAFIDKATIASLVVQTRLESQAKDANGNPMIVIDMVTGEVDAKNANLAGNLTADSLSGTLQVRNEIEWTSPGGDDGTAMTETPTEMFRWSLQAPYRAGEEHSPDIMLCVSGGSQSNNPQGLGLKIQRLNTDGTWADVRSILVTYAEAISSVTTLMKLDTPTTVATTYRLVASGGSDIYVYSAYGSVRGWR